MLVDDSNIRRSDSGQRTAWGRPIFGNPFQLAVSASNPKLHSPPLTLAPDLTYWLLSGTLFVVVRMRIPCLPHHTLNCCSHVQASGVQVQTPNSSPSRSRSDVPRWIGTQVNVNTSPDLLSLSSNREDVSIAVEFDGYDSTSSHRPSTIDNKVDVTIAAHALNIHNLDLEKIGKWTESVGLTASGRVTRHLSANHRLSCLIPTILAQHQHRQHLQRQH